MADEIFHVRAGMKWFVWTMNRVGANPQESYQMLVKRHFRGRLKAPFNDSARSQAGLTRDFYEPLAG
jgi:uncharacterized ferritin-like protein (DUF455 family)